MSIIEKAIKEMHNVIPNFEEREQQVQMIREVYDAMANKKKVAVHAPTGTGKSLAYLIAYVAVKLENPKFRIAVSTFTLNLQDQLKKDFQVAHKVYQNLLNEMREGKNDFSEHKASLRMEALKGKNNYFCRVRFDQSAEEAEISESTINVVERKVETAKKAKMNLDKQNLALPVTKTDWDFMNVERCMKGDCPFFSECTYGQQYFNGEIDISVVNHVLYLLKQQTNDPIEVDFVVFDESHKMEKVLYDASTKDLSMDSLEGWAMKGYNFLSKYSATEGSPEALKSFLKDDFYGHPSIEMFRNGLKAIGQRMLLLEPKYKDDSDFALNKDYSDLGFSIDGVEILLQHILLWVKDYMKRFMDLVESEDFSVPEEKLKEFQSLWKEMTKFIFDFRDGVQTLSKGDYKLWISFYKKNISMQITPSGTDFLPTLFNTPLLLTSGTLQQNGTCSSFTTRIGLKMDNELILNTPFDLQNQTIAYVPPNLSARDYKYDTLVIEELRHLLLAGKMKTFILFTARELMWNSFKALKDFIKEQENNPKFAGKKIEVWIQTDSNHQDIMRSFRNPDVYSVLFGTMTYFEGIDLQGEALTQVILTKLPFSVPTHPVQKILDNQHGFSEWEAVVRFEQAFGRLIRTRSDYGTFAILDNRILKKKIFMDVFENENIQIVNNIKAVEDFYVNDQALLV